MNFLAPLAFAFAASIPVVIAFYLLKRKRVVKLVSSTLLWQKLLADTQACAPSDSPTRLVPALKMAESLVRDRRSAEVHLFSDGAVPDLTEFENKALPLVYHKIGQRGDNLGITALDARANPEDATQRAIHANGANLS